MEKLKSIVKQTHSTFKKFEDGEYESPEQLKCSQLICAALGLSGESGEYVEHIKKAVEQNMDVDKEKLIKELGDVLYYIQLACCALDVEISMVVDVLEKKLLRRYPNGFESKQHDGK